MLFWFYANFCGAHENYLQEKKKKKTTSTQHLINNQISVF